MEMIKRSLTARLFLTLLIMSGLAILSRGQVRKCADFNEYCQNHWDCCSNTCLSYLYRCTQNFAIFPYSFLGRNYAPPPVESTLQQIYDSNFGRVITRTDVFALPQGIYGRFGGEEEEDIVENSNVITQSSKTISLPTTTTATTIPAVIPSTVNTLPMETTALPEVVEIRSTPGETTTKLVETPLDLATKEATTILSSSVMSSTVRSLDVKTTVLPAGKEMSTTPGETTVTPIGILYPTTANATTTTIATNESEVGIEGREEEQG